MGSPCGSITTGIAVWTPALFTARYPEFLAAYNANPALFASLFTEAGLYLNNTACSVVKDVNLRTTLLNMIVAHIAFLSGVLTADGQPKPVGRVSAASQGSVNATFEYSSAVPGTGEWFAQSQYGVAFWQATTCYRAARYFPQPTTVEGFTGGPLGRQWIPGL